MHKPYRAVNKNPKCRRAKILQWNLKDEIFSFGLLRRYTPRNDERGSFTITQHQTAITHTYNDYREFLIP